jgi:hypothetical protein
MLSQAIARWTRRGCVALAVVSLFGCASPARSTEMTPTDLVGLREKGSTVSIVVTGGRATDAATATFIANEDFAAAIRAGIEHTRLFGNVLPADAAFLLTVDLLELQQPIAGFDITVRLSAEWRLQRRGERAAFWRSIISSDYTAGVGEAFDATKRKQLAIEGAGRKNIAAGLREISSLENLGGNK